MPLQAHLRRIHRTLLVLVLAATTLSVALAQSQPLVNAVLDSNIVRIGDQLHVRLTAQGAGYQFTFPQFPADSTGNKLWGTAEVVKQSPVANTNNTFQQDLIIQLFDTGKVILPPLDFAYTGTTSGTQHAGPFVVQVLSPVLSDSLFIAPIKGILKEPFQWADLLKYLYWLLGIFITSLVLYKLYQRIGAKPKTPETPLPKPLDPPHIVALAALEALQKEQLWQQGQVKEYHSRISYILREYIERRFEVPALENTTLEIVQSLKTATLPPNWLNHLREVLQTADLVKFAKATPDQQTHVNAFQTALQLVQTTVPTPIDVTKAAQDLQKK